MTNFMPRPEMERCAGDDPHVAELESWPAREADLGAGLKVRRALPVRGHRRLVGPWCFFDYFGPLDFDQRKAMDVAPHPHIGLQTVSWLFAGEALHNDSLGCEAVARPGELNLMTAGRGIAHSEQTPEKHSSRLHGLQLWVALPDAERHREPCFDHYAELPVSASGSGRVQVFMGRLGDLDARTRCFSPLVGADIALTGNGVLQIPLVPEWEHAVFVVSGTVAVDGRRLAGNGLHYLGSRRAGMDLSATGDARVVLVGGAPFGEAIVMWWNFVARNTNEIAAARDDWQGHRRFGDVVAYRGERLAAPALVGRLAPSS